MKKVYNPLDVKEDFFVGGIWDSRLLQVLNNNKAQVLIVRKMSLSKLLL